MYGNLPLKTILPEVSLSGAKDIDLWPRPHGTQREQVEEMGHEQFAEMLEKHRVSFSMVTRYDLGPFGLQNEMKFAGKFKAKMIVTGSRGPALAKGPELSARWRRRWTYHDPIYRKRPRLEIPRRWF